MPIIEQWPYINPEIRYLGVSWLRKLNQENIEGLKAPVVLKREDGQELAVLVPWQTYLALQDKALGHVLDLGER